MNDKHSDKASLMPSPKSRLVKRSSNLVRRSLASLDKRESSEVERLNTAFELTLADMYRDVARGKLPSSAVKNSMQPDAQQDSSQSTSTSGQESSLNGIEMAYLAGLPEQLANQLTTDEAIMLVRDDPSKWTADLKRKLKPFADEELLELLDYQNNACNLTEENNLLKKADN